MAYRMVVGPLIGGQLASTHVSDSSLDANNTLQCWPYLLPCIVGACFNIFAFIASAFTLEETRVKPHGGHVEGAASTQVETAPLLGDGD